ncbi:MAG: tRNA preQ1(34) S-adenosylmethionine ribosyltransferase-isomerase QueA [Chloroflexi bacterium]|nr:tRNA preQ1(34) S-adenosylmethionine ribosyltransferase-isomerase QueA [Chloroflexota bacterium]
MWLNIILAPGLKTDELDYDLPQELIAQMPAEPRDSSRLLVIHRDSGELEHRVFRDIGDYLGPGDVLVANDSRVIPARLNGRKLDSGGAVEVLLLQAETADTWRALVKPGRRVHAGNVLVFEAAATFMCPTEQEAAGPDELRAQVLADDRSESGVRRLRFSLAGEELQRTFEIFGITPLPPYIHAPLSDPERYQTVYANPKGSVAAPTAGLHFTPELLAGLQANGVEVAYVTCHIGLHTFRPIDADEVEAHDIHEELCIVPAAVAGACARAKRVIAVGTSSVRSLESAWRDGAVRPYEGWSGLYIYPGYEYKAVDAMITNFHLPRTTLMALVSAFAGRELILHAYEEAKRLRYRFYSFGDACLIL